MTIPSTATAATLSFWLHVDTAETGSTAYDTLKVQVRNSSVAQNGRVASGHLDAAIDGFGYVAPRPSLHLFTAQRDVIQSRRISLVE